MSEIENIGQYLKNLREERKIPVAQVAQELKTKLETIHALEANEFHKLPASTYAKGYLRSYAIFLGVDSEKILEEYNRQYPEKKEPAFMLKSQNLPRIGVDIGKFIKPKLLAFIGVVILIAIAATIFTIYKPKKKTPTKETPVQIPIPKETENKTPPPNLTNPVTIPMSLSAHTIDNVWVRVSCDGKIIFEGILKKGEEENWRAQNEIKLRIGNPSKLNLTLNGKFIGNISPYGPVNVTINEKGIKLEK